MPVTRLAATVQDDMHASRFCRDLNCPPPTLVATVSKGAGSWPSSRPLSSAAACICFTTALGG
jgi:hypothetical protein